MRVYYYVGQYYRFKYDSKYYPEELDDLGWEPLTDDYSGDWYYYASHRTYGTSIDVYEDAGDIAIPHLNISDIDKDVKVLDNLGFTEIEPIFGIRGHYM